MVLIHNIEGIHAQGVQDLENFLKKGGGVIWFQGDSSLENFHSDLFSRLDFLGRRNGYFRWRSF